MHLRMLVVKNFRALEDIQVEFNTRVSVIVGPNAAGKTTILEAIRLAKALLAPRTQSEAMQVLLTLGIASPHVPQRLRMEAVARDIQKAVVICCRFNLSEADLTIIANSKMQLARALAQAELGQPNTTPDALIAFLASPQGQQSLVNASKTVEQAVQRILASKYCSIEITFDPVTGLRGSGDPVEAQIVSFLERSLSAYQTGFTYFPADRALPSGEQPVQLGGPDAAQQLESYNSQPQIKFNRLKNTIFNATLLIPNGTSGKKIDEEFKSIFRGILKGRELVSFGVNEMGLLTVSIKDTETNRTFDLDGMSSGEKGLILTFLLIARTVAIGGIVLLDEPELHLNPAVCKDLLSHLVNEYVKPRNLQVIICSHSPEILAGAFDNEECTLYHLISGTNLSKVRPQDEQNISNALQRLGANESDGLLYKGIVFVEGPDDIALLETGFGSLLRRHKLKYAAGRAEIEKSIRELQDSETERPSSSRTFFVFDKDGAPTALKSSSSVGVLQWDRYCLENYLIDLDLISDLLMNDEIARTPFTDQGAVSKILNELALQQLDEVAARNVYAQFPFDGIGMRREDCANKSLDEIADKLHHRINKARQQLAVFSAEGWKNDFKNRVQIEKKRLGDVWATTWVKDCDGKRLFDDLSKKIQLRLSVKKFKLRLMREMLVGKSENWRILEGQLKELLGDQEAPQSGAMETAR